MDQQEMPLFDPNRLAGLASGDTGMPPEQHLANGDTALSRVRQIFRFLKEFATVSAAPAKTLDVYPWRLRLQDLPEHKAIQRRSRFLQANPAATDASQSNAETEDAVLVFARPALTQAPKAPVSIAEWVNGDLNDPFNAPSARDTLRRARTPGERTGDPVADAALIDEALTDDPRRMSAFNDWLASWRLWAETEIPARMAMSVFERLYALFGRIDRESEKVELMLGNGILRTDGVAHPVLLQRMELLFNPAIPAFKLVDADRAPELYAPALVDGEGMTGERLQSLRQELESGGFHPYEQGVTTGFLRRIANSLGSTVQYVEPGTVRPPGVPVVEDDLTIFLRNRTSGLAAAFEWVLEDLESGAPLPTSLIGVAGFDASQLTDDAESSMSGSEGEMALAESIGEPEDVLFSKPANLEQVRIARALEKHGAVLVQGPPGTGKSHTIANLVGHLVAAGNRVLVTSHTTKALGVLRNHLPETLRPLCVSMLEQDLEGRAQLESAVRGIVERVTTTNEHTLEQEVRNLSQQRQSVFKELATVGEQLRAARASEYEPVVSSGESMLPADATRFVQAEGDRYCWLPGPVTAEAPIPLSGAELSELYASNSVISGEDESEMVLSLPPLMSVLDRSAFEEAVSHLTVELPEAFSEAWAHSPSPDDAANLSRAVGLARTMADDLRRMAPWQQAIVEAGRLGGADLEGWRSFVDQCQTLISAWQSSQSTLIAHDIQYRPGASADSSVSKTLAEIEAHVLKGGALGRLNLWLARGWRDALDSILVDGASPRTAREISAARHWLERQGLRREAGSRWDRQASPLGLPTWIDLGNEPERMLVDYIDSMPPLFTWWRDRWSSLLESLSAIGFDWEVFRNFQIGRTGPMSPFRRDVVIITERLPGELEGRLAAVRREVASNAVNEQRLVLLAYSGMLCAQLQSALDQRAVAPWSAARDALANLHAKAAPWRRRQELLSKLGATAPGWATNIRDRVGIHGRSSAPTDAQDAWRWRQCAQELERRARTDERALAAKLQRLRSDLRSATQHLIDRMAWLAQLRRTDHSARQALIGWSDTQAKIGKGKGIRAPQLQAEARKLLTKARVAVPVWIMPLARVAESFDPRDGKFDVVVVDEASQSDISGLLAFYLGRRVVVVGDHEQVSPSAVGENMTETSEMIRRHLAGVPNSHLYDGRTSIYDLARQSFGGTIALREHFRCVPEIIEFSNNLSYAGQMRPLRDPSTAALPHVVEYAITGAAATSRRQRGDLVNEREARVSAALLAAMFEHPAYARATFGSICLVGEEQGREIEKYLLSLVPAERLLQRRFAVGTPAQFQGDERDVMLLSMGEVPDSGGRKLPLRETTMFKQRYNVATSRARNQLWLVHSLEPGRDLHEHDLRRRLIEYVRDPGSVKRALQSALARAESPFETEVMTRLITTGYRVTPQVEVGRYRIDMVIQDDHNQVALECDGDRFHPPEQIPEDLARQAVLERAGWRFIRLRGTRFYRDPEESMAWVYEELRRLNVRPTGQDSAPVVGRGDGLELREAVSRRAWEIMRERQWAPDAEPSEMT